MAIKITISPNGPIVVSGDLAELTLVDSTGAPVDVAAEKRIFLCRCGGSVTKPFCDGHHTEIGFQAAEAAVRAQG
jgi:3-phenylpropionate/trans-cinnamate dioxygenase ferredoxin subunit